jgi:pimeloyl-ACP methyl ester carboxylesterase
MVEKKKHTAADYIHPLNMNGLHGRMLRIPAPANRTREILFVYGHHSSLERWWGAIQDLNQFGTVTVPDLPGFGGMDSFYKIGEKPTLDNFADYLAAFIKLRYKRRRVTIIGLSFGFVVATRMLQRYPDLAKKVDLLISVVGFAHHDDFTWSRPRTLFYRTTAWLLARRAPNALFRATALNPMVLRAVYGRMHNAQSKFEGADPAKRRMFMDFEIYLWHCNDLRTQAVTTLEFLKLDNCTKQIDLPVWHVSVSSDQYFDKHRVEQHMRVIFSEFNLAEAQMGTHAPSVIAEPHEIAPLIPRKIRRVLSK